MSVTVRPYVNGGWEVDIRVLLPDGTQIRERKKAPVGNKSAAQRWAEARERVLLVHGKPQRTNKQEVQRVPTIAEFGDRVGPSLLQGDHQPLFDFGGDVRVGLLDLVGELVAESAGLRDFGHGVGDHPGLVAVP